MADKLDSSLSAAISLTDRSASKAAFLSVGLENPFNLSQTESQLIGRVIGCNVFLLIRAETLRRSSSARLGYYESYAAFFLVNARTGHLIWWRLANAEADTAPAAEQQALNSTDKIAAEISNGWKQWLSKDDSTQVGPSYAEIPAEGSPEAKNFRPPIPYLRIKPEYTNLAYLYAVMGTVEIGVDLDGKGDVEKTEIIRWAGFGLDESVIDAVRKMNWRPAQRNGKPLPAHFYCDTILRR
ncbi:MAG: energy transducer TonB [Candidatus Binatia bacterium]